MRISGVDTSGRRFQRARQGFQRHAVSPEQAARSILDGIHRGRFWVYTSPDIRVAHVAQRYFPPGYVAAMTVMNRVANRALPEVGRAVRDDA